MAKAPLTEKAQDSVNDNNISIVMVQGSFQLPLVYEKLSNNLLARGYPVTHPQLPSCTNPEDSLFPTRTLADDASVVQKELENQVEKDGRTVMVVMHSYGGLVGSESIPEKLSHSVRKAQGLPGGVIHLFYFCAFLLEEGQSVLSVFGESPNNDVRPDGRFYLRNGQNTLYSDLPEDEASLWASRLIPQSHKVQETALTRAAWRYIPSTYLVCEYDQAAPPQYQEKFAATAKAHIERFRTGHSPMLSQPEMLAEKILGVLQRALSKPTDSPES